MKFDDARSPICVRCGIRHSSVDFEHRTGKMLCRVCRLDVATFDALIAILCFVVVAAVVFAALRPWRWSW